MRFGVLGPVQAHTDGGGQVVLPLKPRTLLAVLLLNAGRMVGQDRLLAALWSGNPPMSASRVLRTYVSALRQSLRLSQRELPRLVVLGGGYRLEVAPADLDQLVFADLAARGRQALNRGDTAAAGRLLDQALGLWRGDPTEDVTVDDETDLIRAELVERRLLAEEERFDVGLLLGHGPEFVPRLRLLTAAHPLRERLWGQLMTALHQAGQQAAGLAAYRQLRAHLVAELGVEPSPGLRELHQQILAGDLPAVPHPAVLAVSAPVPRQLPAGASHFTGRTAELNQLDSALSTSLASTLLITAVTGTAGVGKTALAIHWAHQVADRFPDGQLYVNLRGYDAEDPTPSETALGSFLRALGVADSDIPVGAEERAAAYRSLLAGRTMLIVLDNASSVEQVRPLLPADPSCVALVTSRDALAGLIARDGAIPVMLDLLSQDDAVGLLTALIGERAAADPDAAARLAACCCRLPLALRVAAELATARPNVPLAVLTAELEQRQRRLDQLEAGGDNRTAVREVFSWSVRHLDQETVRTFALAALHPGPDLDAWALAAMAGAGHEEANRMLRQLARAHLVQPAGTSRYNMHDLLRAFGRELAASQAGGISAHAALTSLFDYLRRAAAAAVDILYPAELYPAEAGHRPTPHRPAGPLPPLTGEQQTRAWLDAERETLIAVVGHAAGNGWPRHAITLAGIVHRYLDVGGYFAEAATIHDSALRAAELAGDPRGQAHALLHLGIIYRRQSHYQRALHYFERALDLARLTGDRLAEYHVLSGLATINQMQGRYRQAAGKFQQIMDLGRSTDSQYLQIRGLLGLGTVALLTGRYQQSARQLRQAADICHAIGERVLLAATLNNLGYLHLLQGRFQQATEHLEQSSAICRYTGDQVNGAYIACNLALADLRQGQYRRPETQLREALARFRTSGNRHGEAQALIYLGELQLRSARYQHAREDLERALLICDQTGDLPERAEALNLLGEVFLATGDSARAHARHHDALALASQLGDPYQQAHAHRGLGTTEAAVGNQVQSRRHWEQALARYAELGTPEADLIRTRFAATAGSRRQL